jgi:Zn-dependent protease
MDPSALACPECHQLHYAARLEELAGAAREKERAGEPRAAADLWRQALELLPAEAAQAQVIRDRISTLGAQGATAQIPGSTKQAPNWTKRFGPFGVIIVFLLKFKTFILLALTKAKFLLFGLAKIKTLLSMFASMGLYWALYGWKFGVGFILGIYIHEMGHVWALKRFGLRASAPMFIPGFGAFVSLYDSPADAGEDARIGLAGPTWGAAAAIFFYLAGLLTSSGIWMALAHATAYINLFNLTPVWQLDGGRGFRALDRQQRLMLAGLMLLLSWASGSGWFIILAIGAAYRIFMAKDHPAIGDRGVLMEFGILLLVFGALMAFSGQSGMAAHQGFAGSSARPYGRY